MNAKTRFLLFGALAVSLMAIPLAASAQDAAAAAEPAYKGRPISLDVQEAEIGTVLRSLAGFSGVNIVASPRVQGKVTVKLEEVPWEEALTVILRAHSFDYVEESGVYRIDTAEELRQEKLAKERARKQVEDLEELHLGLATLSYANAKEVKDALEDMLTDRGRIDVDLRTNSLLISDIRARVELVTEMARALDTQTPQIMIEARIVEARSTYLRDIGIQWGGRAAASADGGNATGLIFPNSVAVAGGGEDRQTPTAGVSSPSDFAVNLPAAVGSGAGGAIGVTLGSVGGNFNLSLRLSALEDAGSVRIISSNSAIAASAASAVLWLTPCSSADSTMRVSGFGPGNNCSTATARS